MDKRALRAATSFDVARLAGVSRTTVSQVLNNRGSRFTDDTVTRVRKAAEELGYVPSAAGRTLVFGHSDVVLLLIPYTTFGNNLQLLIELISTYLRTIDLNIVVRFDGYDSAAMEHLADTLKPAAIITMASMSESSRQQLGKRGSLLVEMTTANGLSLNDEIGALQVDYLHSRGHTGLAYAFLSDSRKDIYGHDRASGAARRAGELGLPTLSSVHVQLNATAAAATLQTLGPNVTAVLCYNDDVALAIAAGARLSNIAIPDALAIVGVDATEIGQLAAPRLTTIRVYPTMFVHFIRAAFIEAGLDTHNDVDLTGSLDERMAVVGGESA